MALTIGTDTATFSSIAPANGSTACGTTVTVTGTGLADSTRATFGGVAATGYTVLSVTKVRCVTDPHAAGAVSVVVLDPGGNVTTAGVFTYA